MSTLASPGCIVKNPEKITKHKIPLGIEKTKNIKLFVTIAMIIKIIENNNSRIFKIKKDNHRMD